MEKLTCPSCGGEFYLHTGCRICGPPPPGLYTCPECGSTLRRTTPSCFISNMWDEE